MVIFLLFIIISKAFQTILWREGKKTTRMKFTNLSDSVLSAIMGECSFVFTEAILCWEGKKQDQFLFSVFSQREYKKVEMWVKKGLKKENIDFTFWSCSLSFQLFFSSLWVTTSGNSETAPLKGKKKDIGLQGKISAFFVVDDYIAMKNELAVVYLGLACGLQSLLTRLPDIVLELWQIRDCFSSFGVLVFCVLKYFI